jgi:hypothetical protein
MIVFHCERCLVIKRLFEAIIITENQIKNQFKALKTAYLPMKDIIY